MPSIATPILIEAEHTHEEPDSGLPCQTIVHANFLPTCKLSHDRLRCYLQRPDSSQMLCRMRVDVGEGINSLRRNQVHNLTRRSVSGWLGMRCVGEYARMQVYCTSMQPLACLGRPAL